MTPDPTVTDEQRALIERERVRMAEPGYGDTLEHPGDLIPLPRPTLADDELAKVAMSIHLHGKHFYACSEYGWRGGAGRVVSSMRLRPSCCS